MTWLPPSRALSFMKDDTAADDTCYTRKFRTQWGLAEWLGKQKYEYFIQVWGWDFERQNEGFAPSEERSTVRREARRVSQDGRNWTEVGEGTWKGRGHYSKREGKRGTRLQAVFHSKLGKQQSNSVLSIGQTLSVCAVFGTQVDHRF